MTAPVRSTISCPAREEDVLGRYAVVAVHGEASEPQPIISLVAGLFAQLASRGLGGGLAALHHDMALWGDRDDDREIARPDP